MKVVAVSGSPRKNGNTARLIEKCLFRAEDGRSGVFICAGATRIARHFEAAEAVARLAFGVMNIEHRASVFAMGVDAAGEVEDDRAAIRAAYAAGVDLVSR